jgi:hypothetical protein
MELAQDTSTENNIVLYKEPHTDNDDNELDQRTIQKCSFADGRFTFQATNCGAMPR